MDDGNGSREQPVAGKAVAELPADVSAWVGAVLRPAETVAACLFGDILPDGRFGERWTFLTDQRLLVLSPDGERARGEVSFELPLAEIEGAELRDYVGSSALIVRDRRCGHEVARFSLASHPEASDLCHYLSAVVRERANGKSFRDVAPTLTKRPHNRCSKCGRALSRWSEICVRCIDQRRIMVRLFSYLLECRWLAIQGLTLTMLLTAVGLMPPYLTKVLIDDVITPGNVAGLPVVVGILIALHVSGAIMSIFRSYMMQKLGQTILFRMRIQIYDHLQMLRLRFYTQRQTGRIMSRVTGDLGRLQNFVAEGFQELLVNIANMVIIAAILLMMNWKLFLLALAPVPLIALTTWMFGERMHLIYHRVWRRASGLNAILADTIPGIRVVKAFAQEVAESRRFTATSADLYGQEMEAARVSSAFYPLIHVQTALGSILIFSFGGYMVIAGHETVGTLVAFTSYLWRFYAPVQEIGRMNSRLQQTLTSAERVFEILDSDPEPLLTPGVVLNPLRGRVEFRDVRFSYQPGRYALDEVSFTVEPGEMIGLVGPSGAGKSTLVHLIARFYDVEEGEILIDGHNVQDLELKWFREQIGVVLQEPYLFHGSIWSNIAYANPEASPGQIIAAAKAANAHDFIVHLPDGYDTMIGERGQTLSGGERQRVSIARAILRDPKILILDEATASVDTETESMIQAALERLIQNRTTFAIAHRLSTLRKANRLIVLERAKLVEIGTHAELIDTGGLYSRLCRMQSELSRMHTV